MLTSLAEMDGDGSLAKMTLPAAEMTGGIAAMVAEVHGTRARIFSEFGDPDVARHEVEAWTRGVREFLGRASITASWRQAALFNAGSIGPALARIGSDETVAWIYDEAATEPTARFGWFGSFDHFRGTLALRLGKVDEAEAWFRAGLEVCERERCPVEAARNLTGLADAAERRGRAREALQHLDRAIGLFQEHGAKLYLDQAVAMKVRLQGIGSGMRSIDAVAQSVQSEHPDLSPVAAPDGSVTVFVSDIEDSTALNERLGDERWIEVLHDHNTIMRRQIAARRGHEVKTFGDAFMVVFADPVEALRCAVDIQRDFAAWVGEPRIRVRIGLHTGQAVRDSDDFFGTNVTLAFRIAALCAAGQILASSALRSLAGDSLSFDSGRDVELKGISGKQRVFEVRWA